MAQTQPSSKLELCDILTKQESILTFLYDNFQPVEELTVMQKIKHPLIFSRFNRKLRFEDSKHTFLSSPVDLLSAYEVQDNKFCLYIITDLDLQKLKLFSEKIGFPQNVFKEDFLNRDFEFLYWRYNDLEILFNHTHSTGYGSLSWTIRIMNMKYQETMVSSSID